MTVTSKELKRRARASLEGHYFPATSLSTSLFLFSFFLAFLLQYSGFGSSDKPLYQAFYWIFWAITLLLNALLSVGLIRYLYCMCRRENLNQPSPLFYAFQNQPDTFILAYAFRYLITLIWFVPALISYLKIPVITELTELPKALLPVFLLALAGVLPAVFMALPYCLSTYVLLDEPYCSAREALGRSRRLMQGNKLRLFYAWLGFLPLCLLGIGSYGVGFFWIRPYYHSTMAEFYLSVTNQVLEENTEECI